MEYPCDHELIYEANHIAKCIREGKLTSPVVTEELSAAGIPLAVTALSDASRDREQDPVDAEAFARAVSDIQNILKEESKMEENKISLKNL